MSGGRVGWLDAATDKAYPPLPCFPFFGDVGVGVGAGAGGGGGGGGVTVGAEPTKASEKLAPVLSSPEGCAPFPLAWLSTKI